MKRLILISFSITVLVFGLIFLASCFYIGQNVQATCDSAQELYDGDCVHSLISVLHNEEASFSDRNSAIWALGQLGDEIALPTLESYFTEVPETREPLNEMISQYELSKAIKLTSGGCNLCAWVWR